MGARSRRKGHDWEREVAKRISEALGVETVRNLGEVRGDDIGQDLVGCDPLVVQCKTGIRPNLKGAWLEARGKALADPTAIPIAVARMERADPDDARRSIEVVVLSLDDFLAIAKCWWEDII